MRPLTGVIAALSAILTLYHLYAAGVSPFTALVHRPVHFGILAVLGLLGVGVRVRPQRDSAETKTRRRLTVHQLVSGILLTVAVFACGYLITQHEELVRRVGSASRWDILAGSAALVLVLELARRTVGFGLVTVALLALGYALAGPWLPGMLAHRGYGLVRIVEHLYLGTEGIWGVPLGVSADFVFLFILFGALLDVAGGGDLLIGLASRVAGRSRGGPAKTAAVASAFMGSLSGSAVANVVTTGSLTIPLMKRTGFSPSVAGAIEAAASTGGQLMPPIMGAGAFILATWTNIPYTRVALAAALPAVLYYVALFAAIHFHAGREGLGRTERPPGGVVSRLHLLIPLAIIVTLLVLGRSPMRAAFWGVLSVVVSASLFSSTRLTMPKLSDALRRTIAGAVQVASACAAAGIVVGVASLTGIGLRMSELIVNLSGGYLPFALLLTAMGSIVLGMGLPTTAAYVVLAALGAPALTELGVPLLVAHLFIFYFGAMSNVTPPVSLAGYAAAGIAGAPPMRTALLAMAMAGTGFAIPFVFVYRQTLLLSGSVFGILIDFVTTSIGVVALAAVTVGFITRPLTVMMRMVTLTGAVCLFMPAPLVRIVGLVIITAVVVSEYFVSSNRQDDESPVTA